MKFNWLTPWRKLPPEERARHVAGQIQNNNSAEHSRVRRALNEFHGRLRKRTAQADGLRRYLAQHGRPVKGGMTA